MFNRKFLVIALLVMAVIFLPSSNSKAETLPDSSQESNKAETFPNSSQESDKAVITITMTGVKG